ncbi:MAG: HAD family phosphatase [Arcanobacterium sp.]|nr:HAD family phosphatase [Arcanobacterium sp.]
MGTEGHTSQQLLELRNGVTTVVFDIGGVLVAHQPDFEPIANLLGIPTNPAGLRQCEDSYRKYRAEYDLGMSDAAYWRAVAADAGVPQPDDAAVRRLVAGGIQHWFNPDPEPMQLIQDLSERGISVAILSNAPHYLSKVYRGWELAPMFRTMVFSADIALAKPDRRIYEYTSRALGKPAHKLLFFDDRRDNVAGAIAAGWQAHQWKGADEARALMGIN